jgi:putative component of membrane protein insertase Oxa1/YidC/SpoIIIJ protein YidD
MFKKNLIIALLICSSLVMSGFLSSLSLSSAESGKWGPWDRDSIYQKEIHQPPSSTYKTRITTKVTTLPIKLLITFFQQVISPVDGATCDFYPTCSGYAKQALKKHGLFIGLAMASERAARDHSPEGYDLIFKFGRYYIYDPVENNDFWFYKERGSVR